MQVAAFATGNMEWLRHGTEDLGGTAAFADWGGFPKGVVIGMTTCESASSQVVMGMTGSWITPTATEQCAEISQIAFFDEIDDPTLTFGKQQQAGLCSDPLH